MKKAAPQRRVGFSHCPPPPLPAPANPWQMRKLLDLPDTSLCIICLYLLSPRMVDELLHIAAVSKSFQKILLRSLIEELHSLCSKLSLFVSVPHSLQSYRTLHAPRIFLLGGSLSQRSCHTFDPATGQFRRICSLGIKRSVDFTAVFHRGVLFSLSGDDMPAQVEAYDVFRNTWHAAGSLPWPLVAPAVVSHRSELYILGGAQSGSRSTAIARLSPLDRCSSLEQAQAQGLWDWTECSAKLLTGRSHCGVASYGGLVWLAGGIVEGQWTTSNTVEVLDPTQALPLVQGSSSPAPSMLRHRNSPKLAVIDDCLYAIGGDIEDTVHAVGSIEKFDVSKQAWVFVTFFLEPRRRAHCAIEVYDGKIFLFGGVHGDNVWKSWDYYDARRGYWASQVQQNLLTATIPHAHMPSAQDMVFLQQVSLQFDGARAEGMNCTVAVTYPAIPLPDP